MIIKPGKILKALLLKNRLNTAITIEMAKKRHKFMEQFFEHLL
jgi:hypothetical protein